jgi:hypothetical protein
VPELQLARDVVEQLGRRLDQRARQVRHRALVAAREVQPVRRRRLGGHAVAVAGAGVVAVAEFIGGEDTLPGLVLTRPELLNNPPPQRIYRSR